MPWIETIAELALAKAWMLEFSYASSQGDISLAGAIAFDQASKSVSCVMNIRKGSRVRGLSFTYDPEGDTFCAIECIMIRATGSALY